MLVMFVLVFFQNYVLTHVIGSNMSMSMLFLAIYCMCAYHNLVTFTHIYVNTHALSPPYVHLFPVAIILNFYSISGLFPCFAVLDGGCSTNPCLNGGNCTDTANGFACDCPPSYTGTNCENGKHFAANIIGQTVI